MTYIWINPVTESMYEETVLERFLVRRGLVRVRCKTDWGSIVREKYRRLVEVSEVTIADARCPMACGLVREVQSKRRQGEKIGGEAGMKVADIEPILIHCAREISGRKEFSDGEKIITTPCRSLADMGNSLGLKHTRFMTWNDFLKEIEEWPEGRLPEASPIPLGFFSGLEGKVESLTGKKIIENYVEHPGGRKTVLVEMLYCDRGCHNGDGVVREVREKEEMEREDTGSGVRKAGKADIKEENVKECIKQHAKENTEV